MCTKAYLLVCGLLVWAIVLLCPLQAQRPPARIIYSNSFEAPADTSSWMGLSPWMFVEDPAPSAGARSLLIGGGCDQPAAWIDVPCTTGVATFHLSFWGKAGAVTPYGGTITVGPADWHAPESANITIYADSLNWHFYQAEQDLHLGGIDTLRIQIWVGGFVYDDVQIDGLEVVVCSALGTQSAKTLPAAINLGPAYPNPFNPITTIRYTLPASQLVTLTVYDLLGREVATLMDGLQLAGEYQLPFDAGDLSSGIYIARLVTPEYSRAIMMVLLR